MKFLIVGAGAVGSFVGGRLASAGHDVTMLARPSQAEAIARNGLTIDSRKTGLTVSHPLTITAIEDWNGDADIVLISVKSYDTDGAAGLLKDRLAAGARVMTIQNGIDNHERIATQLPSAAVFPAVMYVGVSVPAPGVVRHVARGEIILPDELADAAAAFDGAGVPAARTNNILGVLWGKFLANSSCNALSMMTGASFGELAADPESRDVIRLAVMEVMRLANIWDIDIPFSRPVEEVWKTAESLGEARSSMFHDFEAGKRTELDALNGKVVRMGRDAEIPVPVHSTIYATAGLFQRRRNA